MSISFARRAKAVLKGRFRNYRIARYVLYITTFWAISIFLAPLSLEPHTVENLDANANWIDYGDQWADMARYNPYAASIYLFGDFNCHQRDNRSQTVHGNQLPVCARDVGIAAGTVIGALFLFFVIRTPYMFLTFLSVIPERFRTPLLKRFPPWLIAGLIALPFLLPTGFDGFYQLLTSYESTNTIRLVTGFFMGILLSWGFGSAFLSVTVPLPVYHSIPEQPTLNDGSKSQDADPSRTTNAASGLKVMPQSQSASFGSPQSPSKSPPSTPPSTAPSASQQTTTSSSSSQHTTTPSAPPSQSTTQPIPDHKNDTTEKKEAEE